MVKIIIGLFDLFLLYGVGASLYRFARYARYGTSRLRFQRFPFFLGEELEVVFSPNRFDKLELTLRFVEERVESYGSGDNRNTRLVAYEHYRAAQTLEVSPLQAEVSVRFDLPDNPEWENSITGEPVRYWDLLVEAEAPGVDFRTTFRLPVYASRGTAKATAPSGASVSATE